MSMNSITNEAYLVCAKSINAIKSGAGIVKDGALATASKISGFIINAIKFAGENGYRALIVAKTWTNSGLVSLKHFSILSYNIALTKIALTYGVVSQFLITYKSLVIAGVGGAAAMLCIQHAYHLLHCKNKPTTTTV